MTAIMVALRSSVLISPMMLFLLATCGVDLESALPTLGPVTGGSGPEELHIELSADKNCVEIGELVTFTFTITNNTTTTLRMTGSPAPDIVVTELGGPIVARWSEDAHYPRDISPTLQPAESRRYHWQWQVERAGISRVGVYLGIRYLGSGHPNSGAEHPYGEGANIILGIGHHPTTGEGIIPCAEMPR